MFPFFIGKKYAKIKKTRYSIRGDKKVGPWFAFIGLGNTETNNLSQGYYFYKNKEEMCFENYYEIIPNEKKNRLFDVKEVEIYQINFL